MHKNGAFTGEISAEQIKDFELKWTLIGHSERRSHFAESDSMVAQKVVRAQEAGLNAIVCIGETEAQREAEETNEVLKTQLDAIKDCVTDWNRIVIAYEPIWAIGTGKSATPEIAQDAHAFIRQWFTNSISEGIAAVMRIQYGGSVNAANCAELIA